VLFIALIAALGIGSIIAAVVGWWSAKAVAISNHRQNWINALRDDLVTFLKEVDLLHYRVAMLSGNRGEQPTIADLEKQQDARNSAMLVYRRILLRLNMTEPDHTALGQALRGLMLITNTTVDSAAMAAAVDLSRRVLKAEWAVTKFGLFTRPMLWAKARRRKRTLGRGPGIEMELGDNQPAEFGPQLSATLIPAADDPPRSSPEMQVEFWNVTHALQARGMKVSSRVFVQDSVDGGMTNLGQLTIDLARDFAPAVTAVLGAWGQARFGRKVRLKVGDIEAEAGAPEEIEKLLALAA
jgi:hypothetical protein